MKISRNAPCPCNSGKKYKHCCINTDLENNSLEKMNINSAMYILEQGLSNNSQFTENGTDWNIKEVKFLNGHSLIVEYYTKKKNPMDIKVEMSYIISYASSFLNNDGLDNSLFTEIPQYFGVSAFNENDEQLLYVLSSAEISKKMANGDSIEWLKNSYFEDTTEEFLIKNSKIKISTIEKSLRKLIYKILENKYGENWITKINQSDYKSMFSMYKRATGDNNKFSMEILDYSFLPNLKDIISDNFIDFKVYFHEKSQFIENMNKLNKIRRVESHNRTITYKTFKELEELYNSILLNVSKLDDSIAPQFTIDNWHDQIFRIIDKMQKSIPNLKEDDRNNNSLILMSFLKYHESVVLAVNDLGNVLVPLCKMDLHNELTELLKDLSETLNNMIHCGKKLEIEELNKHHCHYQVIMDKINKYSENYIISEHK